MKNFVVLFFSIFLCCVSVNAQLSLVRGDSISIEPADESISINHNALEQMKNNYLKLQKNNPDFESLNCALSELNCKNVDEGKSASSSYLSISPFDYFYFFSRLF